MHASLPPQRHKRIAPMISRTDARTIFVYMWVLWVGLGLCYMKVHWFASWPGLLSVRRVGSPKRLLNKEEEGEYIYIYIYNYVYIYVHITQTHS